ncbi:PREDICTED: neuronal acetylcholine receptor subunit alpha-7-like, partial [Priapulus caudatus]|uniref:Neuronal acetylcholine receptor subunit alpha-7-like n=1 Tax=Priapulus caudatus TaxID=37621 RepID=A0ABM1ESN2_PRICU
SSSSLILLLSIIIQESHQSANERRLLKHLLEDYQPLERPVVNESEPVRVSFGIDLQQIIDVDEKNQIMLANIWLQMDEKNQILTANVWLNFDWNDANLRWPPEEYGGIMDLRIPPHRIWKPDVLLYNSADERFDSTYPTNVVVSHDGNCSYLPPGIFKSTCKINIAWFPFDEQRCKMKFGSWTYNGFHLELFEKDSEGSTKEFVENGEWKLLGSRHPLQATYSSSSLLWTPPPSGYSYPGTGRLASYLDGADDIKPASNLKLVLIKSKNLERPWVRNCERPYASPETSGWRETCHPVPSRSSGCPEMRRTIAENHTSENQPSLSYTATKRLSVTILLSLMMFLMLVNKTMPATSDAVPIIGVTILLALMVFLLMIAETIPATSDAVPIIGTYFACTMFMCAMSVCCSVLVLNFHHRRAEMYRMSPLVSMRK